MPRVNEILVHWLVAEVQKSALNHCGDLHESREHNLASKLHTLVPIVQTNVHSIKPICTRMTGIHVLSEVASMSISMALLYSIAVASVQTVPE